MNSIKRDPIIHELKSHPDNFQPVYQLKKTAELRLDDRDFRIGDTIVLKEWKPKAKYFTGRSLHAKITWITRVSRWIEDFREEHGDYVVLSFKLQYFYSASHKRTAVVQ